MKLSSIEIQARDIARQSWNEQCKRFVSGNIPFRDKTMKECYNRILKELTEK